MEEFDGKMGKHLIVMHSHSSRQDAERDYDDCGRTLENEGMESNLCLFGDSCLEKILDTNQFIKNT